MASLKKPAKLIASCFLAAASLIVYFAFAFHHIGQFETADEHYWIYSPNGGRVWQYWNAIATHNWPATYINDKPGITVALVSGPALLLEKGEAQINEYERGIPVETRNNPDLSSAVFRLFRIPIVIFNGLFSLFFLWTIWKITKNKWIAFWGWLLILFSPVLVGISQIVNPDSLLWSFSTAALLSFFLVLQNREKKYVFLTALFFGFSLLTKYAALILVPFFAVASLAYLWFYFDSLSSGLQKEIRRLFFSLIFIFAGAVLLYVIFLPGIFWNSDMLSKVFDIVKSGRLIILALGVFVGAVLVDGFFFQSRTVGYILKKTQFLKNYFPKIIYAVFTAVILFVIVNWTISKGLIPKIYSIAPDLENGLKFRRLELFHQLLLEFRLTVFSLAPIVLFAWLWLLLKGIFSRTYKYAYLLLYLMIFVFAFYAAVLQQQLLITMRYGIMLYPLLAILAALEIEDIFSRLRLRWKNFAITFAIIAASAASLWSVRPFYFNYSNFLLNKSQIVADGWGYGGYEAAQYLNSLPNSENLKVWADYRGFCAFFKGKCVRERNETGDRDAQIDYFIKTRRGEIIFKARWENIRETYLDDSGKPVWQLEINHQPENYVKIYKSEKD